jgi:hypothetical protein
LVVALFGAVFVGICGLGIFLLGPFLASRLHIGAGLNEILGDFLNISEFSSACSWACSPSRHTKITRMPRRLSPMKRRLSLRSTETSLSTRSRTAQSLEDLLKEYTRYVIEDAWPLQRVGIVPDAGVQRAAAFQARLATFEPQTKGQEAIHEAALRQFNTFFEYRRTRLYSVDFGIPLIMWVTVAVGAAINIILIWLFKLRRGVHLLLGGLISFYTATMICLIALLDNPYRGEVGVSPGAFQMVYDHLMK